VSGRAAALTGSSTVQNPAGQTRCGYGAAVASWWVRSTREVAAYAENALCQQAERATALVDQEGFGLARA
jgi:hypothetical protein